MSVAQLVFHRRLLSSLEWNAAIRKAGFELEMDPDTDTADFDGYWPCKYGEITAGFEYGIRKAAEFLAEIQAEGESFLSRKQKKQVAACTYVTEFLTHSRFDDLATATITAAVLAAETDGYMMSSADLWIPAVDAIEWARKEEQAIRPEIDKEPRRSEE
jgi:hypothetical protein